MVTQRQQGASVARDRSVDDLSAAGALVRRHDPDRFLLCLFVPAPMREAALTLVAYNHELARAVEVGARRGTGSDESRMTSAIRLQWWRDVVDGERRRHEVADPLGRLLDSDAIERAPLLAMIEAREAELEGSAADRESWWRRLELGPGQLARALGSLTGLRDGALDWCGTAGAAYGAGACLRHRDSLAAIGRHPLPTGTMEADIGPLADAVLARLRALPPFRAERARRAAALHAVLAARDLRRARAGTQAAGTQAERARRPVSDTAAVAFAWWSGRIGRPAGRSNRGPAE